MIRIDGQTYNVPIVSLEMKADFLDRYAERTDDGELHRGLIGVYYNYAITFGSSAAPEEYARLWNKLTEPTEFHDVTVYGVGADYSFRAYFSNVSHAVKKVSAARAFWKSLTANFIAKSPARRP